MRGTGWTALGTIALAVALISGCTSSDGGADAPPSTGSESTDTQYPTSALADDPLRDPGGPLELLALQTSGTRIVDIAGRDVLLRGANVNSLGEYWQGIPEIPANLPVTDDDWDVMASHGFSVIRLLVTWSRIEPERGKVDEAYLDEVNEMVNAAADHGIYSVIDMHQDAYSAFIYTEDPAECGDGTSPAKGWDGAPKWATITDGLSTCLRSGDRNSSPAVEAAWNHFYANTDQIQDHFVDAWAAIATRFAGRVEVAGFDLLNEPENSMPSGELQPIYEQLIARTIAAIRGAQSEAGAPFEHIVFVEPALPAAELTRGLVVPTEAMFGEHRSNVAVSVHNYMESINHFLSLESLNDTTAAMADGLGVPNWGGEYGFWNTKPETLEVARRYAADEDAHRWGGAWWQWRQSCGDPHSVKWEDGQLVLSEERTVHLNILGCPGNDDLGPNDDFLRVVGRGFARATPGSLTELSSDIETGELVVRGTGGEPDGAPLVIWSPTDEDAGLVMSAEGLGEVTTHNVTGGRYFVANVVGSGDFSFALRP